MEAAPNLRLRVMFMDRGILSKSQKKNGLQRSWILLKPHLDTISDVVSYLIHSFNLHDSCPHGILLSVDGFVLPPFESTAILKERDLLRVKRKGKKLRNVTKAIEGEETFNEDEIVEKQPFPLGIKLLANEEFDKETGGYQSETDEDEGEAENTLPVENAPSEVVASKKRKASRKIESSKSKRQRRITPESISKKHAHCSKRIKTVKKKREQEKEAKGDALSNPEVIVKSTENQEPTSDSEECSEPEESREGTVPTSVVPNGAKKVSRSTLRKRLKRKFRKEQRAKDKMDQEQCERQTPIKDLNTDLDSNKHESTNIIERQQAVENSDGEGDMVPVVIRPGYIRFTPSEKAKEVQQNQKENGGDVHSTQKGDWVGHSAKRNQVAKETFQWNGITNKRKGQKWGMEKQPTSSFKELRDYKTHSSTIQPTENQLSINAAVDFEKLVPLTGLPKAGDIIAYRLLELSSSWCPELSAFRIGKISWFESESNRIMLAPDPEYPLNLEKETVGDDDDGDASGEPPESSVYNEDGSLEIDFPSLVDVRIVKHGDLSQSEGIETPVANGTLVPSGSSKRVHETEDGSKKVASDASNREMQTRASENGNKDMWEEISEALSAKKAQLTQEDDSWNKKESPAKRSWSYRALRGSALGPTMAMLRAQNGV